jgi:hypothetical protein
MRASKNSRNVLKKSGATLYRFSCHPHTPKAKQPASQTVRMERQGTFPLPYRQKDRELVPALTFRRLPVLPPEIPADAPVGTTFSRLSAGKLWLQVLLFAPHRTFIRA